MAVSLTNSISLLHRCNSLHVVAVRRLLATTACLREAQEHTKPVKASPAYPPIFETSKKAEKKRDELKWHKMIQDMPTVEEKQLELNMPKYYGHWTAQMHLHGVYYNHAEYAEFVTRTRLAADRWPELYASVGDRVKTYLPRLQQRVEDILMMELVYRTRLKGSPMFQEKQISSNIIWAIHHALVGLLGSDVHSVADMESVMEARLEAFWWSEGIPVDSVTKGIRKWSSQPEEDRELPVRRPFQYQGCVPLMVLGQLPLPQLEDVSSSLCHQAAPLAPACREPRTRGIHYKNRHGTNVPGVWSDAVGQCARLVWMTRHHLQQRAARYGEHAEPDRGDALAAQTCMAGFSAALAQACQHGFTPLTELTYPITTQTIITDGRWWSFGAYQLNTTGALIREPEEGSQGNVCWSQPEMQLFESVGENGVEGLNEAVLERLLQMYLLPPSDRSGIPLRPYLNSALSLNNIEEDLLRTRYRDEYFRTMSNRPRHMLKDEVYLWEWIYKIKFNTRPQDARKRFFELRKHPTQRRLDDLTPVYIPRALRPEKVPSYLKQSSKYEPNPHHWMARLRGRRDERPSFYAELEQLEQWRQELDQPSDQAHGEAGDEKLE